MLNNFLAIGYKNKKEKQVKSIFLSYFYQEEFQ